MTNTSGAHRPRQRYLNVSVCTIPSVADRWFSEAAARNLSFAALGRLAIEEYLARHPVDEADDDIDHAVDHTATVTTNEDDRMAS